MDISDIITTFVFVQLKVRLSKVVVKYTPLCIIFFYIWHKKDIHIFRVDIFILFLVDYFVYFAIENNDIAATCGDHGLRAVRRKVDDGQAAVPKCDAAIGH